MKATRPLNCGKGLKYKNGGVTMIITEEMKHKIEKIADTYGFAPQTDVAIEEMAELTKELLKFRRAMNAEATLDYRKNIDNIVDEMADVQIMLLQLDYLLHLMGYTTANEWNNAIMKKLDRQISRIREQEQAAAKIKIVCSLSEDCDEKGAGGLWDLSAEIAFCIATSTGAEMPIDTEKWGQDRIYNILCDLTDRRAAETEAAGK